MQTKPVIPAVKSPVASFFDSIVKKKAEEEKQPNLPEAQRAEEPLPMEESPAVVIGKLLYVIALLWKRSV